MNKEQTLEVINEIIDESSASMKKEVKRLLDSQEWDYDAFGNRNTFARVVMECIFEKEKGQYAVLYERKSKEYKRLKNALEYALAFITE